MTKSRWIVLVAAIVVCAAAAGAVVAATRPSDGRADDSPLLVPSTAIARTTTSHPRPTTTTVQLAKLPQPDPPPADPYANVPVIPIGAIEIPKIGLLHTVYEGITLTVIDHGPGHWPGSALPCQAGNTVFPGHRVTHSHPFLNLDLLSPGDQFVFHMPKQDCVYRVTGTQIVRPTDMWVTDPTPTATATLIACHPKHSAAQRIVVKGALVRIVAHS
jgi:sortase A